MEFAPAPPGSQSQPATETRGPVAPPDPHRDTRTWSRSCCRLKSVSRLWRERKVSKGGLFHGEPDGRDVKPSGLTLQQLLTHRVLESDATNLYRLGDNSHCYFFGRHGTQFQAYWHVRPLD